MQPRLNVHGYISKGTIETAALCTTGLARFQNFSTAGAKNKSVPRQSDLSAPQDQGQAQAADEYESGQPKQDQPAAAHQRIEDGCIFALGG